MITKKQIFVMSATACISVANIYYNQPILNDISKDLNISHLAVGNLPTFSQVGYGVGLFFISNIFVFILYHFVRGIFNLEK